MCGRVASPGDVLHTIFPGSLGTHTPVCPTLVQVAFITPRGNRPGSHWKVTVDPSVYDCWSVVFTVPLEGAPGGSQVTEGAEESGSKSKQQNRL